ncbi:MAG: hypothetical protein IT320_27300 [Anaerolineae bacterium]|nr:hypothetical protein [Anaerolineae bacterium]
MADTLIASPGAEARTTDHRPYGYSWVDQLCYRIDRLPGPGWMVYAGLWAVFILIDVVLRSQGSNSEPLPPPFALVYYATPFYLLWLLHTLDGLARRALHQFYPALECDETTYRELSFRLTTMPPRPVLLASLAGLLIGPFYLSLLPFDRQMALIGIDLTHPALHSLTLLGQVTGIVVGIITGAFVYHTWHQLRTVSEIYRKHTCVNLFEQTSMYAFSNLSAATAIGMLVDTYAWSLASPLVAQNTLFVGWMVIFSVVCALTFVAPFIGAHNLLKATRDEHLLDINRRLQQVSAKLHTRVDAGDVTNMDDLNKAIQSLELEYQIVKRQPTWPWNPEAPRAVVATLFFPILLWLMEEFLGRVLG